MEISKGIETIDLCAYLKKYKTLVIADLHLGYEESLSQKGVLVPKLQFKDTYERLTNCLETLDCETVVITGDLKHEFGLLGYNERKEIIGIIDLILTNCKKLIIIKGNHDVALPFLFKKKNIELVEYYSVGEFFICHGDELTGDEAMRHAAVIIIGHEHPAIGLRHGRKYESFKCFLKGKYLKKELIVLPSFNKLTTGTDVLRRKLLSPFLQQNLNKFKAYVIEEDKIYDFGKLEKLNED
jgi:hypothetical protein